MIFLPQSPHRETYLCYRSRQIFRSSRAKIKYLELDYTLKNGTKESPTQEGTFSHEIVDKKTEIFYTEPVLD